MSVVDLVSSKKIIDIKFKDGKRDIISNIRHYLNEAANVEMVMIAFMDVKSIQIWDSQKWECLSVVNTFGRIGPVDFLIEIHDILIVTSTYYAPQPLSIQIFDIFGNKKKALKDSNKNVCSLEIYFDEIKKKNFIIAGSDNYIISYDYEDNKVYKKYMDSTDYFNGSHFSLKIREEKYITKIIESCTDGNIRIWAFDSGTLLNKIRAHINSIYWLSMIEENLIVGSEDGNVIIINLNNNEINYKYEEDNIFITTKIVKTNILGDILAVQSFGESSIIIYKISNN